jgi:hypothetical protein
VSTTSVLPAAGWNGNGCANAIAGSHGAGRTRLPTCPAPGLCPGTRACGPRRGSRRTWRRGRPTGSDRPTGRSSSCRRSRP